MLGYAPFDFAPYVTAPDSVILFGKQGALVQPRLGAQPGAVAVAAFGVGAEHGYVAGQLAHFDGVSWSVIATGTEQPIQRLWGIDGQLFYISTTEFGRADQGGVEPIVRDGAGLRFWDLWGRAGDEVFLTVTDESLAAFKCGEKRALWYDGAGFHRF